MDKRISEIAKLLEKGDVDKAFAKGAKLAKKLPKHPRLHFLVGNAALQGENYAQAVIFFSKADALHPDAAEIKNNLGAALLHEGDLEAAVTALKKAISLRPSYSNAQINLATAYKKQGLYKQAEAQLLEIRKAEGDTLELVAELADIYRLQQRWDEAADAYRTLSENDPEDSALLEKSIEAMVQAGNVEAALQLAQAKLADKAQAGSILAKSGDGFLKTGHVENATRLFRAALALNPDETKARLGLAELYRGQVARWHFSMLNDDARNQAYDEAIKRAVKPGDIVLDIGTGTGLLAMMAARAGAKHVYSCESVAVIADKAREIIAANGFAEKITIISKWSHEMVIGEDMPAKADVLVSEIVDNKLIGEGIMAMLDHALVELVKEDAKILPIAGKINVVPVECKRLFWRDRADSSSGFDVSAFGEFTSYGNFSSDMVRAQDYRELGNSQEVFSFDFTKPSFEADKCELQLSCTQAGDLHGVLVWFELVIDEQASITNHPERGLEHWGCSFCFLDQARKVKPGDKVDIIAAHDTTAIDFRFG